MFESCLLKQSELTKIFNACPSEESRYEKIIEFGRKNKPLSPKEKTTKNRVQGCQSTMYLLSTFSEGLVFFQAESDALISSGLAAILIFVYSGETPETILKCPPNYLEELKIGASLTPNRANGLYSIHLRMKQEALNWMMLEANCKNKP